MLTPITLAIIEDQAPIQEALQEYLRAQPEFAGGVVVDSMEVFLEALDTDAVPPQLLLSDIGLPGCSGIEGLPLIQAYLPDVQTLILSVFADAERVYKVLCAGAVGYLLRTYALALFQAPAGRYIGSNHQIIGLGFTHLGRILAPTGRHIDSNQLLVS